jgi:hypothetical protein
MARVKEDPNFCGGAIGIFIFVKCLLERLKKNV